MNASQGRRAGRNAEFQSVSIGNACVSCTKPHQKLLQCMLRLLSILQMRGFSFCGLVELSHTNTSLCCSFHALPRESSYLIRRQMNSSPFWGFCRFVFVANARLIIYVQSNNAKQDLRSNFHQRDDEMCFCCRSAKSHLAVYPKNTFIAFQLFGAVNPPGKFSRCCSSSFLLTC